VVADDEWIVRGVLQSAASDWTSSYEIIGIATDAALKVSRSLHPQESLTGTLRRELNAQTFRVVKAMLRRKLVRIGDCAPFVPWPGDLGQMMNRLDGIEKSYSDGDSDYWFDLEITDDGRIEYNNRVRMITSKMALSHGVSSAITLSLLEVLFRIAIYGFDEDDDGLLHNALVEQDIVDQSLVHSAIMDARDQWWSDNRHGTVLGSIEVFDHLLADGLISATGSRLELDKLRLPRQFGINELLTLQESASNSVQIELTAKGRILGGRFSGESMQEQVDFMTSEWIDP